MTSEVIKVPSDDVKEAAFHTMKGMVSVPDGHKEKRIPCHIICHKEKHVTYLYVVWWLDYDSGEEFNKPQQYLSLWIAARNRWTVSDRKQHSRFPITHTIATATIVKYSSRAYDNDAREVVVRHVQVRRCQEGNRRDGSKQVVAECPLTWKSQKHLTENIATI